MEEIAWSEMDVEDDGTYDLCGRHKGKYVDVMHLHSRWEFHYDGVLRLAKPTRDEAKQAAIDWVKEYA
jgi:hypothetical protein